ncbi:SDR family oxidoreductase [Salinactinospora qingdaonensis]|uniref:SDR family oxidoreductase n=1 Tax=Salinactinospora qingdaonensis TaxID=702744 RepID=A0ABP7GJX5_9ACTN
MLVERLATISGSEREPRISKVVAIDGERGDVEGVTWRVTDARDPRLAGKLAEVDVLVHADDDRRIDSSPRERRAYNIRGAQTVLTAAAAERVQRVILLTSTMVYGADPANPIPIKESAPAHPQTGASLLGDFAEIEELAVLSRRAHPGLSVTVVRPAPLVGPELDTLLSRHFSAPRLLAVKGCEQAWQFCHVEDLVDALAFVVAAGVDNAEGVIAVGSDGALSQAEACRIAQLREFEVAPELAFSSIQRLHRRRPAPDSELRFLVYPCVVDCATLRDAGWRPAYDNSEALRELLEARSGKPAFVGRSLGRKEATITAAGAAGAAAAAIGTAAAVHRLRRRRRD